MHCNVFYLVELSDVAAAKIIANNTSTNVIYAYNDLDDPQDFNSIIDAIPTDGFNPLWLQKLIVFNPGFTPHQFFSDDEVLPVPIWVSFLIHQK